MSTHFIAQLVRNAVEKQRPFDALAAIINLQPVDVADVLAQLKPAQAWALLQELPERAQVFACFAPELQMRIAAQAPRGALAPLVGAMAADERADVFKRLDESQPAMLLRALAQEERDGMRNLAAFAECTAGALMTSGYASLKPHMQAAEAIVALRHEAPDAETIYHAFVVDEERRLLGAVSLRELILAAPEATVGEVMVRNGIHAEVSTTQEEAARLVARYSLLALPIVNGGQQLVGIATYDDAMHAASAEATEDIHKGAAVATFIGNMK